jgi:hypothetical protein
MTGDNVSYVNKVFGKYAVISTFVALSSTSTHNIFYASLILRHFHHLITVISCINFTLLTNRIFIRYFLYPWEKTCIFLLNMVSKEYRLPHLLTISVKKGMIYMNFKNSSFEISVSPEFATAIGQLIVALHLAGII